MSRRRRFSPQTAAIVGALAENPETWRHGYDLCQTLDLKPGTVYPILRRLADRALVDATWEGEHSPGRPRVRPVLGDNPAGVIT